MLHERARWPEVIYLALWSYLVMHAVYIHHTVPSHDDNCSRLELFAGFRCGTKMNKNHAYAFLFLPSIVVPSEVAHFQNGLIVLDWT